MNFSFPNTYALVAWQSGLKIIIIILGCFCEYRTAKEDAVTISFMCEFSFREWVALGLLNLSCIFAKAYLLL
jgi:hypothetical protein